jgi:DNA-binding response OmpR family regulator
MNVDYPILILDDEIDICFLLGIFLKKQFQKVDSIHSIHELQAINVLEYKIVFVDNNLSDGSGFDEIAKIKRINNSIKVIAISAFDTSKEKSIAIEKGADIFLGKPFNQEEILSVVNRMIAST